MFGHLYQESFRLVAACQGGGFFGFPTWYKYLGDQTPPPEAIIPVTGEAVTATQTSTQCVPVINGIGDFWLIAAAVVEMLLRLGALVSIVFVLIGGIKYMTSQGEPDKTSAARSAVLNAVYGLGICVVATAAITFFAGRFTNT